MTQYAKIRASYMRYLAVYKQLNKGSTEGATPFGKFYMNEIYNVVYNDERTIALMSYN